MSYIKTEQYLLSTTQSRLKWISLAIVLTAPLLSVIDIFVVNIALPTIKHSINANDAQMQLVVASYLIGYASFMITGSRSGDYYGKKKVFFWSMLAFGFTSALCGLSQTPDQLNLFRFLQGISGSFMVPQTISYIQVLFKTHQERTKAFGFFGMTAGVGATLGQFIGGYFSSSHFFIEGWRFIFFINIPVCVFALAAIIKYLPKTDSNKQEKFDIKGTILLTLSLISFIYPVVEGRENNWPLWCIVLLGFSLLIFYVFIIDQQKKSYSAKSPLINMSLFSIKDFNIGIAAAACYFIFHTSYLFITTLHFQETLNFNPMDAGLSFIFFGIGFTTSSLLSIKLVMRFGKKALQAGVLLMIIMMLVQLVLFSKNMGVVPIDTLLLIQGFGMGLVLPSVLNFALRSVPLHLAGAASGVYSTIQQVSSAVGIAFIGGVYFYFIDHSSEFSNKLLSYRIGMSVDIGFLILLGIALYLLNKKQKN